jgi:glycosyltransferase involved in cell wall biosynthesis
LINSLHRVSIGLPVFNGDKYLEEAICSILNQDYRDFELIIVDNASTDRTQDICTKYVKVDNRIKYVRNKQNIGIVQNFNKAFGLSSGEYFKWAAYDDTVEPNFLSQCVEKLDSNPDVVLCHSITGKIDEEGRSVGEYILRTNHDSPQPHVRFSDLISMRNYAWVLAYGLIRSKVLRKTPLFGGFIGSDRNLLAELGLYGRFYILPTRLFLRRQHSNSYTDTTKFGSYGDKLQYWVRTNQHKRRVFPYFRIWLEYIGSIKRSPLKFYERLMCYFKVCEWLLKEGWFYIGSDIMVNSLGSSVLRFYIQPLTKWLHDKLLR